MQTQSFKPIVDDKSTVLILGTMPSIASLTAEQYYRHQDNLFWDIIFRVCYPDWKNDELVTANYETKKKVLFENRIALWDVLQFCDRQGSLDKNIRNQVRNDFNAFFLKHPNIKAVFFNGKKASEYFKDYKNEPTIFNGKIFITLPSTSPSNTINSFYILKEWLQIRNYFNN